MTIDKTKLTMIPSEHWNVIYTQKINTVIRRIQKILFNRLLHCRFVNGHILLLCIFFNHCSFFYFLFLFSQMPFIKTNLCYLISFRILSTPWTTNYGPVFPVFRRKFLIYYLRIFCSLFHIYSTTSLYKVIRVDDYLTIWF